MRKFAACVGSIDAGLANSPEGADQGKQLGVIVTFNSEGDRNYYVGQPQINPDDKDYYDPDHLAFKKSLAGLLDPAGAVFVFDYTVGGKGK